MTQHGICLQTLIPVRSNSQESSEMVTQLLFGEIYSLIETQNNWVYIEIYNDGYKGWIDIKLVSPISPEEMNKLKKLPNNIFSEPISHLKTTNCEASIPIVAGSIFYKNSPEGFSLNQHEFLFPNNALFDPFTITEMAKKFINAPYLWGGKTMLGIDCSGLVQIAYGISGIQLPRDASQQAKLGVSISFINEAKPGDLAFFDNDEGQIIHVGIILENNEIIHASGFVRIDSIDHQGIFNKKNQKYSHKLRIIKRIKE